MYKQCLFAFVICLLSPLVKSDGGSSGGGGYGGSGSGGYQQNLAPMPYSYAYDVKDSYSGADYDKKEQQDSYGNLQGQYSVQLPDGRRQVVSYTADDNKGFIANVAYSGNPVYQQQQTSGYRGSPQQQGY